MDLSLQTVLILLGIIILPVVKGFVDLPFCNSDEYVTGSRENPYCKKCLICEVGFGLNEICNNHVILPKYDFVCIPCSNGTHSGYNSSSVCDECSPTCGHNEVETRKCTSTTNRHCKCKSGIYLGPHGECDQVCCHCGHGAAASVTVPKCQSDNIDGRICAPPGLSGSCPTLSTTPPKTSTEMKKSVSVEKIKSEGLAGTTVLPSPETTKEVTSDVTSKKFTTSPSKEDATGGPSLEVTTGPLQEVTSDGSFTEHTTNTISTVTVMQAESSEWKIKVYWICSCIVFLFLVIFITLYVCHYKKRRRRRRRQDSQCYDGDDIWMEEVVTDQSNVVYASVKNMPKKPLFYKPSVAPPVPASARPQSPLLKDVNC